MVDLKNQYLKIKPEIDKAIFEVIDSTAFVKGNKVKEFEKEFASYMGVKHVIACANGTDALQLALMALDLKPGDEVITSDFTFIATVEVIALLGLTPVLVDIDYENFNMIPELVKKAITSKTKAIIPVHLFGQCAPMEEIMEIAKEYKLYVIEDSAQASGASYKFQNETTQKAGTIGDVGCTSFFPSKNLGCFGDGGALMTNNDALAEKISIIANHGMKVRYYHDMIGINSRLDTIQAAVLCCKLKYLDQFNKHRREAADYYDSKLSGLPNLITPYRVNYSDHIFHQYTLKLKNIDRDKFIKYMNDKGIPAMIYYPVPLHSQKAYKDSRYNENDFQVSNQLSNCVLSLPMHSELDKEQLEYITSSVIEFVLA